MALNLSQIITRIKMKMGIYGISLPIENVNDFIRETIEMITIPTFSLYQPYYQTLHINTSDLQKDPRYDDTSSEKSAYLLPLFETQKLLTVADVQYSDNQSFNYNGVAGYALIGLMPYTNTSLIQQSMLSNVTSQMYQNMYPRLTYDFIEPRTLIIYNQIVSNSLAITLSFEHHKSLATIPSTCDKSFFDLALYDCMINFYQIAKHWSSIETSIGTINLHIDEWQDAESKRTELLNEWDNTYHLDIPNTIIYK